MSFAWNLKTLRTQAELTQGELAEKVGASQKTISSWETGRTEPTMGDVYNLCEALGCTMDRLTGKKTYDLDDITFDDVLMKVRTMPLQNLYTLRTEIDHSINAMRRLEEIERERNEYLHKLAKYEEEINLLRKKIEGR